MRSKSFAVRSPPNRRNSPDPYPSPASIPGEANARFDSGDAERVPDSFDEGDDVPPKKRLCLGTSETDRGGGGEGSSLDACIVCDISDGGVTRCSGAGCIISFHWECLNPELSSSSSSEDVEKNYCPYCWYKVVVMKHESLREKGVGAEKEVSKHLSEQTKSKDHSVGGDDVVRDQELRGEKGVCSSEREQLHVENDSDKPREEDMLLTEEIDYLPEDDTEKFQDAEEDKDEETTKDQTNVSAGAAGANGDVSGNEQDQVQQNENERSRRRIRQLIVYDTDSDISSDESPNERNGDDVNEQMAQVVTSPSETMENQHRQNSAVTKVANSKDTSLFKSERKRLFWTPEEEEMLKVGVEKFSAEAKKNMPWRKILEMGVKVFHETRTPADLKDKWRSRMGPRGKKPN